MPIVQLYTTLSSNKIPVDFQHKTALLVNQVLKDIPLKFISIHVFTDQLMYTGNFKNYK